MVRSTPDEAQTDRSALQRQAGQQLVDRKAPARAALREQAPLDERELAVRR